MFSSVKLASSLVKLASRFVELVSSLVESIVHVEVGVRVRGIASPVHGN